MVKCIVRVARTYTNIQCHINKFCSKSSWPVIIMGFKLSITLKILIVIYYFMSKF